MSFSGGVDAYDRFMGRYSGPLASSFADLVAIDAGHRVLDVGCGSGALTRELGRRVGFASLSAIDPSPTMVAGTRMRFPGLDIREASAEALPFADHTFDAVFAQLVVHFMADPVAGLREMARVTRLGGAVAACVWDQAGGTGPLAAFWTAALELDATAADESNLPGTREGHLGDLARDAGLEVVLEKALTIVVEHPTFEDWWEPYTFGVGPAGAYLAGLDPQQQVSFRERCRAMFPNEPFSLTAQEWAVSALVSSG